MREYYKKAIKNAEVKMNYNKKIAQMITKELKSKEMAKNLRTLNDISEEENKKILELINIFYELYDISKNKKLSIITNIIDNLNFNFDRIQFEKNTTKEKDAELLANYFKTDFILKVEGKKKEEQAPATLEEQFFNDKFNDFEKQEKNGENEKKEENPEDKKGEEKKEEEKKEEEKKEEEKEEEKEEDDVQGKTIKEKKKIIEKKINEKGGFQQGEAI